MNRDKTMRTVRVRNDQKPGTLGNLLLAIAEQGGDIGSIRTVQETSQSMLRDLSVYVDDEQQLARVLAATAAWVIADLTPPDELVPNPLDKKGSPGSRSSRSKTGCETRPGPHRFYSISGRVKLRTYRYILIFLAVLFPLGLLSGILAMNVRAQIPEQGAASTPTPDGDQVLPDGQGSWVVRAYFTSRAMLDSATSEIEPWEVHHDQGYMVLLVDQSQYSWLASLGFRMEIDEALTDEASRPPVRLPGQINGIPGYPCYRTVEETFTTAQDIILQYPDLTAWVDIGNSWEKTSPGGLAGYDLSVLRLTNDLVSGPKPKLFVMSSIHAREYTPAELNTRFAEYLVEGYNKDPDITWLLDYHEIHLMLQSNPDGRKRAEGGLSWRKNTNNNYCSNTNSRGADLNRNFEFQWGCCGGSSGSVCAETYRGPSPASEPETQAVQNYVRAQFPDQREASLTSPAPPDATGVFIDLHSYSQLVLWPWGFDEILPPNANSLQSLGRRFAYFNRYTPQQAFDLYSTDGTTDDFAYGELGVAAYTFELGTAFFQNCSIFENTILPDNLLALIYAARVARAPYLLPSGPDILTPSLSPVTVEPGAIIQLDATVDDTRFNSSTGTEPTQNIAGAEFYIDVPPWITTTTPLAYAMDPADGAFNATIEAVTASLDTTGLSQGRHTIFIRGRDTSGAWGPVSAVFLDINAPCISVESISLDLISSPPFYPNLPVDFRLNINPVEATPPLSFTLNFSDGSQNLTGTSTQNPFVRSHSFVSAGDYNVQAFVQNCTITTPLTATKPVTINPNHGITLTPAETSLTDYPGSLITHTLHLANIGDTPDTISLTLGSSSWPAVLTPISITLQSGMSSDVTVQVSIPVTAPMSAFETRSLMAQSSYPGVPAVSSFVTTRTGSPFDFVFTPASTEKFGSPGQSIPYTLTIENNGSRQDTYQFSASGQNWPTSFSFIPGLIAPGMQKRCGHHRPDPCNCRRDAGYSTNYDNIHRRCRVEPVNATLITRAYWRVHLPVISK